MGKDKKITVLYVHANNRDIGGADYCLFKLASELDKKQFKPIVCLCEQTEILELYDDAGIKTYVIDMERIKKSKSPLYIFKLFFRFLPTIKCIMKIIKDEHVNIVHGNDLLDIYGPLAGRLQKIPVTQYVRWILVNPAWLKRVLTDMVYRINDMVLTVSDGVAKEMFSRNGRILSNVATCYDWIDMDKVGHSQKGINIREEFGIPPKITIVGCVGRLEPWKGQQVFIKAVAEVVKHFPNTIFLVVGGTVEGRGRETYADHLKSVAKELNVADKIIFAGHRPDITDVMTALDIFVHSSITPDPLPGVVMEAMFCRRPVVGANAGGVPEEVEDGKTGILYEPGDHVEMAKAIIKLLEEPSLARKMGVEGRKRVESIFNKTDLCARMENIYKALVNSRRSILLDFGNFLWK